MRDKVKLTVELSQQDMDKLRLRLIRNVRKGSGMRAG